MSKRDFVVSHRLPVAAVDHRELVVLVPHILAEVVHRRTAEVLHHTPAAAAVVRHILVVGAHHTIPVRNHLQMDLYYFHYRHPVANRTCSSD